MFETTKKRAEISALLGEREREQEQRESETEWWKQGTGSRGVSRWKVNPSASTGRISPPYLRQRGVCSYLEICTIVCFKDLRDASNVYIINYFRLSFWFFFPSASSCQRLDMCIWQQFQFFVKLLRQHWLAASRSCSVSSDERLGKRIRKQKPPSSTPMQLETCFRTWK